MPSVTKTFSFTSNTQGWVGHTSSNSVLSWDSSTGNPAGSLKTVSPSTGRDTPYWEWTGTWEDLGVPAGLPVNSVNCAGSQGKVSATGGVTQTVNRYQLWDNTPTLIGTMLFRGTASDDVAFVTITGGSTISVPSAITPSNSTIRLRIGADINSSPIVWDDNATFIISYGTYTGNATLSKQATFSASGSFLGTAVHGSMSLSSTHSTITASSVFTKPIYTATFSKTTTHSTISSSSSFAIPVYRATFSQSTTHSTISSSGHLVIPVYSGTLSQSITRPTIASSGHFETPLYSGSLSKNVSNSTISASGVLTIPAFFGSCSVSANHPTFVSGFSGQTIIKKGYGSVSSIILRGYGVNNINTYTNASIIRHGTASPTIIHPTIISSSTFLIPVYVGTSTVTTTHTTLISSGVNILPAYLGNASLVRRSIISSDGTNIIPLFQANSTLTTNHAIIDALANFGIEVYHGFCPVTIRHPIINASGSLIVLDFHGTMAKVVNFATFFSSVSYSGPNYLASETSLVTHPIFSSSATYRITNVINHGQCVVTINHPIINSSGKFLKSQQNIINFQLNIATDITVKKSIATNPIITLPIADNIIANNVFLYQSGQCQLKSNF